LANDNFVDAEAAYAKAEQLKPTDEKLKAERKLIDDKKNSKYADLMAKGNAANLNKKFDEATGYYNEALILKKGWTATKNFTKKHTRSKNRRK